MKNIGAFIILFFASSGALWAQKLHLIISLQSTKLPHEGYIKFNAFLYNESNEPCVVPAPQAEFSSFWHLQDAEGLRPDREGTHFVLGTDTIKKYRIKPKSCVRCQLGDRILAENGDLVEFYITINVTSESGTSQSIRSNTVMLYKPK